MCKIGFIGNDCGVDINECKFLRCVYGLCLDLFNDYKCICDVGFIGRNCFVVLIGNVCDLYFC